MATSPWRDRQACCPCRLLVCATGRLNVLSRLITTYYLLDTSANGYCPNAWEPRELWPQRFAFTTLRDALEIERVMHLFPAWKCHRECLFSGSSCGLGRGLRAVYVQDGGSGAFWTRRVASRPRIASASSTARGIITMLSQHENAPGCFAFPCFVSSHVPSSPSPPVYILSAYGRWHAFTTIIPSICPCLY